jgi:hypothetical protein
MYSEFLISTTVDEWRYCKEKNNCIGGGDLSGVTEFNSEGSSTFQVS